MEQNSNETQKPNVVAAPKKKSKAFLFILIALLVAGGWFGLTKYLHAQKHEETDDAQIEANISAVIPRVGGYIKEVKAKDNQIVNKGDTLLIMDDRDFLLRIQQAEAALETAKSNMGAAQASTNASKATIASTHSTVNIIDAQIDAAKIAVRRASQDFVRYQNLIQDHSITQQQFEQAEAAKQTAEKQLDVLIQQKNQVGAQTNTVAEQSSATGSQVGVATAIIKQREVEVAEAKLNLTYTVVVAQESGMLSKVNLQSGQFVQAGQPLFNIVLNKNIWVIANFKETQFEKMKVGQNVSIYADAFPNHDFEGVLNSFSPATGGKFALLPADNSSGNFVKVVQRLPVKIEFKNMSDAMINQLVPGMNVSVDVHIDNK